MIRPKPFFSLLGMTLILAGCANSAGSGAKNYGQDAMIAPSAGARPSGFTCPSVPAPAHDLHFESIYRADSPNSSDVDPDAFDNYKEASRTINGFEGKLTAMANRYALSNGIQQHAALCVQDWLAAWANADALNGDVNRQGVFVRTGILASVATAWNQVRHEPALDADKKQAIQSWLRKTANNVRYNFPAHDAHKSRNNNHMYWAAWSVMATGLALDQQDLYEWGLRRARQGINTIQPDGTLPLELFRGSKALNYHSYAAIPLFMMTEAAAQKGTDLYGENDKALYRLASRIIGGVNDPSFFEKETRAKQNMERMATSSNLVWLEPYYKRTRDPAALVLLQRLRPMKHSRAGGNVTLLYRRIK